jgi:predicted CoA-substrate-specific enzyme activase
MRCAGIDIGSRSIELVILNDSQVVHQKQADTGFDPMKGVRQLIQDADFDRILATGYGRNLFEVSYETPTVTEIKAYARGVWHLFPGVMTILDIGGQDSKAIALTGNGRVKKFEMNDRCAAGTGKFLEIMASALGFGLDEFGTRALQAETSLNISSMCTVFAESEVTSLIAKGEDPREIALGLHAAVVRRAVSMVQRVSPDPGQIVFAGGVAQNPCMQRLLEQTLNREVLIPEYPQMVGALGAALLAQELSDHGLSHETGNASSCGKRCMLKFQAKESESS